MQQCSAILLRHSARKLPRAGPRGEMPVNTAYQYLSASSCAVSSSSAPPAAGPSSASVDTSDGSPLYRRSRARYADNHYICQMCPRKGFIPAFCPAIPSP